MANRSGGRNRFAAGLALATIAPLVVAPLLAPSSGRGTAGALGTLVVVAYAGHVAVTGWLWRDPGVPQMVRARPVRAVAVPVVLVVAGAILALMVSGSVLEWLLMGFFAWQFTHFQRQNLGLATLIAARWNAGPLHASERRLVAVAGWCGTAALVARPALLGLSDPTLLRPLAGATVGLTGAGLAGCAATAVVVALRSKRPAPVAAASVTAIAFVVPVFVFSTPAAAVTGMVIAHGLQYLWVVGWRSHAARRPSRAQHRPRRDAWRTAAGIAAVAVAGGSLLEAMSELHGAHAGGLRLLYGVYLGIVMAHFAVDGVLWRGPSPTPGVSPGRPTLLPSPARGRL